MGSSETTIDRLRRFLVQPDEEGAEALDALFGAIALARGYVTAEQLEECVRAQASEGGKLGELLLKRGFLTGAQFLEIREAEKRGARVCRKCGHLFDAVGHGPGGRSRCPGCREAQVPPGWRLGKYLITREVGRGGMAVVYEAEDPVLKRRVALKVLREGEAGVSVIKRLHREAEIAAQLQHPNIVTVHEVGTVHDEHGQLVHFIAMDFIEGRTLEEVMKEGRTPRPELIRMLEEIARAVAYAHSKGIVHRDLKPGNVLVDAGGRPLLTDFGLARATFSETRLTQSQAVMGTPQYMAPEQAEGRTGEIDARTDVYALGVMLYEMLTGRPPFATESAPQLLHQIVHCDPPRPRGVERDLEVICLKAMEKERSRRYADGGEFAEDLARFRRGEPIRARPASLMYRVRKKIQRHPAAVAAVLGMIAAVGLAAVWIAQTQRQVFDYQESFARGMQQWQRAEMLARVDGFDRAELRRVVELAVTQFRRAAEAAPGRPEPWWMIGRCWIVAGRGDDAEDAWTEALKRDPAFGPARFERGKYYLSTYARLRASPTARIGAGRVRFGPRKREGDREGRYRQKGEADLDLARKAGTLSEAERKCLEGMLAYGQGQYRRAAELLGAYVDENPADSRALVLLAYAAYHDHDFLAAERHLSRALAFERRTAWLRSRGDVYICLGRYDRAIKDLDEAIEMDARNADAYGSRAIAHAAMGRLDEAKRDCEQALKHSPLNVRALNAHGVVLALQNRLAEAEAEFQRAIDADALHVDGYNNKGLVLMMRNEFDEAIRYFSWALQHDPDYVEAYYHRGQAYLRKAEFESAVGDFQEAVRREPSNYEMRLTLAQTLYAASRVREAAQELERVLAEAPPSWPRRAELEQTLRNWKEKR